MAKPGAAPQQRGNGNKILHKILGVLALSAIAALSIWQWQSISQQAIKQSERIQAAITPPIPSSPGINPNLKDSNAAPLPTQSPNPVATASPDQLLNHRRYAEAASTDLVLLKPNSQLRLQPPVKTAVIEMIAKAKAEGVQLGIASAFRSIEDQNRLFFDVKAERGENSTTRAEVSAPPGYSEHHTGYAVDFIDESKPGTHTEESFETTPAYRWLTQNAPAYNFELSFPKDPSSPVSYEPWHWRYVGDQKSLELFYQEQKTASESASELAPTP